MAYLLRRYFFFALFDSSDCTELFAKANSFDGFYYAAIRLDVFRLSVVRNTFLFGCELCVVGEELESVGKKDIEL